MARPDYDNPEPDTGPGVDPGVDYSTPDGNLGVHYNDRPRGSGQVREK